LLKLKELIKEDYPDIIKVNDPLNRKQKLFDGLYIWNNKYWEIINPLKIEAYCINKLVENCIEKEIEQKRYIKIFLSEISIEETDKNTEYLFCIKDGIVDIKTLLELKNNNELQTCKELWLKPHNDYKDYFITMYSDVSYISPSERDLSLIKDVLNSHLLSANEMLDYFLNFISSFLVNDNRKRQFFEFYGKRGTCKTTIVNLIVSVLGSYATVLPEGLLSDKQSNFSKDLFLQRKRHVFVYSETGNKCIKTSLLKRITGKSLLEINGIKFIIKSKIIIDSNFLMKSDNNDDEAFIERRVIIPFVNIIPEGERISDFDEELIVYKNDLFSEGIDRISNYFYNKILKPSVSLQIENKEKLLNDPVKYFYETCCNPTNTSRNIDSQQLYKFFIGYFHSCFIEMLKINGIDVFDESDIKNTLNISQNIFNKEVTYLHKNTSRTNNRLLLNNLELKFEKKYWGDNLEILRKNDITEGMEKILNDIKTAKGKIITFDMPFDYVDQLKSEINEETGTNIFRNKNVIDYLICVNMKKYLENQNEKIVKIENKKNTRKKLK